MCNFLFFIFPSCSKFVSVHNKIWCSPGYDDENSNTLAVSPSHSPAGSPAAVINPEAKNNGNSTSLPVPSPSNHSPKLKFFTYTLTMIFVSFFAIFWSILFIYWGLSRPLYHIHWYALYFRSLQHFFLQTIRISMLASLFIPLFFIFFFLLCVLEQLFSHLL